MAKRTTQINKFSEQNKQKIMVRINLNANRNAVRMQQTWSSAYSRSLLIQLSHLSWCLKFSEAATHRCS